MKTKKSYYNGQIFLLHLALYNDYFDDSNEKFLGFENFFSFSFHSSYLICKTFAYFSYFSSKLKVIYIHIYEIQVPSEIQILGIRQSSLYFSDQNGDKFIVIKYI